MAAKERYVQILEKMKDSGLLNSESEDDDMSIKVEGFSLKYAVHFGKDKGRFEVAGHPVNTISEL